MRISPLAIFAARSPKEDVMLWARDDASQLRRIDGLFAVRQPAILVVVSDN
jgi:hypothetical protein